MAKTFSTKKKNKNKKIKKTSGKSELCINKQFKIKGGGCRITILLRLYIMNEIKRRGGMMLLSGWYYTF
jgi:hypothetical protein